MSLLPLNDDTRFKSLPSIAIVFWVTVTRVRGSTLFFNVEATVAVKKDKVKGIAVSALLQTTARLVILPGSLFAWSSGQICVIVGEFW